MKILIIGLGSIAKKHIQALKELNIGAELHAFRNQENAGKEEDIKNLFSITEIEDDYDFAIISNPTNLHFNAIALLIEKNIPLFIEKPPLASLVDAEELSAKLIDAKIKTYVACNLRFHPCITYLKQLTANNNLAINEVNVYCGSYLPDWRPNTDFRKSYSADKSRGGGVHLDLYHEIDYTQWLFGEPRLVKSYKTSKSSLKITSIDYANYLLGYKNFSVNIILNYYRKIPKRSIEILLSDKTIEVDLIKNEILEDERILFSDSTFKVADTYVAQMKFFITHVLTDKTQMNTFAESLQVLKTCLNDE